jgi:hypothetical protein
MPTAAEEVSAIRPPLVEVAPGVIPSPRIFREQAEVTTSSKR